MRPILSDQPLIINSCATFPYRLHRAAGSLVHERTRTWLMAWPWDCCPRCWKYVRIFLITVPKNAGAR